MRTLITVLLISAALLSSETPARAAGDPAPDSSPHKIQFVTVDQDVKLEVLDWGGTGRPIILLAGLGNDAHVFDQFAPKLASSYHVYGISRRGFGASSAPATGYSADRLGEDVVAVMNSLKIDHPVLIGHSLAGEELSYVGSRYPQKAAGLVYLDAGYPYAFYDTSGKALNAASALDVTAVDIDDVQRKLTQLLQLVFTGDQQKATALIDELLADLPRVTKDLSTLKRDPQSWAGARSPPVVQAIFSGLDEFTSIGVPILAIFAEPHAKASPPNAAQRTPAQVAEDEALETEFVEAQIAAIKRAAPQAQIVRLPHANHYVFRSNEDEVLNETRGFIEALPPP